MPHIVIILVRHSGYVTAVTELTFLKILVIPLKKMILTSSVGTADAILCTAETISQCKLSLERMSELYFFTHLYAVLLIVVLRHNVV